MTGVKHFLDPLRGRGDIVALLVFAALVMAGNGLVAPVLSVYGTTLSASGTLVGMIITIFGLGRLATNIPAGILAQRFGRRPVLIVGPLLLVIGSVGAALAADISSLLLWRLLQGVGSGIYMTVSTVMLADIASDRDRGHLMALHQASLLLGAGMGPVIGGVIADLWGYKAPFWAYGVVCAAGLAVALTAIRETLPASAATTGPEDRAAGRNAFSILRDARFLIVGLTNFGIFFTRTATLWMAIPLLATREHGLSLGLVGLALALATVANFLMLPFAGAAIERCGATRTSLVALLVTAGALAMIALGKEAAWFWTGLALLGAAGGFNGPAVTTQAAEAAPRQFYGQAIGTLRTAGDIGFVLGPLIIGFLSDVAALTSAGAVLLNAALLAATAGLTAYFGRKGQRTTGPTKPDEPASPTHTDIGG